MAKMKTKKIVAKRFKISAGGKIMHRVQGARHIRRRKSKARQRRQDRPKELKPAMSKVVRRFLAT